MVLCTTNFYSYCHKAKFYWLKKKKKSLRNSIHPPKMEINPQKMVGSCPRGSVIINQSHRRPYHPMECMLHGPCCSAGKCYKQHWSTEYRILFFKTLKVLNLILLYIVIYAFSSQIRISNEKFMLFLFHKINLWQWYESMSQSYLSLAFDFLQNFVLTSLHCCWFPIMSAC